MTLRASKAVSQFYKAIQQAPISKIGPLGPNRQLGNNTEARILQNPGGHVFLFHEPLTRNILPTGLYVGNRKSIIGNPELVSNAVASLKKDYATQEELQNAKVYLEQFVTNNDSLPQEARDLLTRLTKRDRGPWSVADHVTGVNSRGNQVTVSHKNGENYYYL